VANYQKGEAAYTPENQTFRGIPREKWRTNGNEAIGVWTFGRNLPAAQRELDVGNE
jgi:hypothetical protein